MAVEIERKFRVINDAWRDTVRTSTLLRQGYLANTARASIRKRFNEFSLERARLLRSDLRAEGVDTVQLRTDAPYVPALQRFFKSRSRPRV